MLSRHTAGKSALTAADLEVKLSVGGKTITGAPYRFARFLYYQV
jgi:hypothetical protein